MNAPAFQGILSVKLGQSQIWKDRSISFLDLGWGEWVRNRPPKVHEHLKFHFNPINVVIIAGNIVFGFAYYWCLDYFVLSFFLDPYQFCPVYISTLHSSLSVSSSPGWLQNLFVVNDDLELLLFLPLPLKSWDCGHNAQLRYMCFSLRCKTVL